MVRQSKMIDFLIYYLAVELEDPYDRHHAALKQSGAISAAGGKKVKKRRHRYINHG